MLNNPVGQLLPRRTVLAAARVPLWPRARYGLTACGLFVVERETEETELDDGTKLAGQAAE